MLNAELLVRDDLLMALVPPIGYRSRWTSLLAFLKLAQGMALSVDRSELDFFDARETKLARWQNAFGLSTGLHLNGPYSEKLSDDRLRPEAATLAKWSLNDFQIETNLVESQCIPLSVRYLPLQVPIEQDAHLVVSIVNLGETFLNIAIGMQEAVCRCDRVAYASTAARVWNGTYLIRPGRATRRCFRLSDFPGIPRQGTHAISLEILGQSSPPQTVTWCGDST